MNEAFQNKMFEQAREVARTPEFLLNILLLEQRLSINQAIEYFNSRQNRGYDLTTGDIKARLFSLFIDIKASMEDYYKKLKGVKGKAFDEKKRTVEKVNNLLKSDDYEELIKAYDIINRFLYVKGVTKFDAKTLTDESNIIMSNLYKGYG